MPSGLAVGSPIEERNTELTVVGAVGKPASDVACLTDNGSRGVTVAKRSVSTRSEYNEFADRTTPKATLFIYAERGCSGTHAGYPSYHDKHLYRSVQLQVGYR